MRKTLHCVFNMFDADEQMVSMNFKLHIHKHTHTHKMAEIFSFYPGHSSKLNSLKRGEEVVTLKAFAKTSILRQQANQPNNHLEGKKSTVCYFTQLTEVIQVNTSRGLSRNTSDGKTFILIQQESIRKERSKFGIIHVVSCVKVDKDFSIH